MIMASSKNNDHKPNRRQRRAMDRVGNKIADRIFKQQAIKKVKNDTQEEAHKAGGEVSDDANARPSELDNPSE